MTNEARAALDTVKVFDKIGDNIVIEKLREFQTNYTFEGGLGLYIDDQRLRHHTDKGIEDLLFPVFEREVCECGNFELWVLGTASYETSAYCPKCKRLWEVHSG